jgi:HEAT repeat protein
MSERGPASFQLARALSSSDPEERRRAVSQLGSLPVEPAVPLVMAALGDEDWRVRKEATFAARQLLPAAAMITALVDALHTSDVGLCNAAVDVLGAAGAAATPYLDEALRELGPDGRKLAVEALGRTRDRAALAPLRRSLEETDPNIRQTAAESVAALGAVAPDVVEGMLLSVLSDPDPIVRLSALSGLDALGATIPWDRLVALLDDATLRPLALAAVARAGHTGAPAVLARALGASSGRTFEAALAAFAHVPLDPLPEAALAALRAYEPGLSNRLVSAARASRTDEGAAERRRTALLVGAALGDRRVIGVAVEALGDPAVGGAAQAALERLGAPAVEALVARLHGGAKLDAEDDARAVCVEALAHIAQRNAEALAPALGALRSAARGSSPRVSARALYALGGLGGAEDLALVEAIFLGSTGAVSHAAEAALSALAARHLDAARALWDDAEGAAHNVRAAVVALGALAEATVLGEAEPRALRFLSQAAISEDAATRRAAAAALARVGGEAAAEALVYALADEEREVRRTAARGLGRLSAVGDNSRLLGVVRASGDPELLAAAVRAAGEVLSASEAEPARDEGRPAPSSGGIAPLNPTAGTSSRPPKPQERGISNLPPASAHRLVAALASLCEDPAAEVAIAALDALRRAAPDVPDRLEAMARALEHPDVDVIKTAILKLAGAIAEAAESAGLPSTAAPSTAAPTHLPRGVWERLRACLDHELTEMRLLAAESLCVIDASRGREALVERARIERDPDVLAAIDDALSAARRQKKGAGAP